MRQIVIEVTQLLGEREIWDDFYVGELLVRWTSIRYYVGSDFVFYENDVPVAAGKVVFVK